MVKIDRTKAYDRIKFHLPMRQAEAYRRMGMWIGSAQRAVLHMLDRMTAEDGYQPTEADKEDALNAVQQIAFKAFGDLNAQRKLTTAPFIFMRPKLVDMRELIAEAKEASRPTDRAERFIMGTRILLGGSHLIRTDDMYVFGLDEGRMF
ncbi:hypothetical protein TSH7_10110 [Azospirillum sp. TSH7]|uniref:hypothetical protein n=1 Tax=unclassified Azospirillum TaxID=2630922 RepID=UPI000D612969|nr:MULTISPECIES: hypothetical protein [unclassified Azospirillum]PWC64020.1 hypothetical protein TSH20_19205 [Azospirillum sp. TSH20]PWC64883.1 hypothetical protein TSH7_10110 [Azospirillum sp. TSH7]